MGVRLALVVMDSAELLVDIKIKVSRDYCIYYWANSSSIIRIVFLNIILYFTVIVLLFLFHYLLIEGIWILIKLRRKGG